MLCEPARLAFASWLRVRVPTVGRGEKLGSRLACRVRQHASDSPRRSEPKDRLSAQLAAALQASAVALLIGCLAGSHSKACRTYTHQASTVTAPPRSRAGCASSTAGSKARRQAPAACSASAAFVPVRSYSRAGMQPSSRRRRRCSARSRSDGAGVEGTTQSEGIPTPAPEPRRSDRAKGLSRPLGRTRRCTRSPMKLLRHGERAAREARTALSALARDSGRDCWLDAHDTVFLCLLTLRGNCRPDVTLTLR